MRNNYIVGVYLLDVVFSYDLLCIYVSRRPIIFNIGILIRKEMVLLYLNMMNSKLARAL